MAKKKYIYKATGGINQNQQEGVCLSKNMINLDGINQKRQGHKNIAVFTDLNLKPLRINGIHDYKYVNEQGSKVSLKIVHAGKKLFRCDESFLNKTEISCESGIIKDEKSHAVMIGKNLLIAAGGELAIFNGETVIGLRSEDEIYIPTTSIGITDQENGMACIKNESPNLLTRRRRNKMRGSNIYREEGKANLFLLDTKIKYNTNFVLAVRIRTRTSEEEISDNTTSYIGINENGEEVGTTVTIRYTKSSINQNAAFFVTEPIKDDEGNIINLKFNDKVYTYDKLPFGVSLKNYRELRFSFEAVTPVPDEDNITVEFDAQDEAGIDTKNARLISLSSGENGKELLIVNYGDNKLYFSDKELGIFHMPSDKVISLGNDSEPITAIVRLSENLIGVFKKKSFYRVCFTSSNENGYETFFSSATIGAYNQQSACVVNYDCLVFNQEGVFGVSDYKSTQNVFDSLRSRSSRINNLLRAHTKEEKENAVAYVIDKRYYLFIGDNAYVADTRYKVNGTGADSYGYEWWMWTNVPARVTYSDGYSLYFGTSNGQIRKFTDEYCDIDETIYKTSDLSLLCEQAEGYTRIIIPSTGEINENATVSLSEHLVLLKENAEIKNGTLYLGADIVLHNGISAVYPGMIASIYDGQDVYVGTGEIRSVSLLSGEVALDTTFKDGTGYNVYLKKDEAQVYSLRAIDDGYQLLLGSDAVIIKDTEKLEMTIRETKSIECELKTPPICFDLPTEKKTLKRLWLKLSRESRGNIGLEVETKRAKIKKELTLGKSIDFNMLDFDMLSFDSELDILVSAPVFLRGFEYLTVKIESLDNVPFGIDTIYFEYNKEAKAR